MAEENPGDKRHNQERRECVRKPQNRLSQNDGHGDDADFLFEDRAPKLLEELTRRVVHGGQNILNNGQLA